MPIRFDPSLIPRYDSSLLRYLNENFQQLKRLLGRAGILDISDTEPGDPGSGDIWMNTVNKTVEIYDGTDFMTINSYESIDWTPVVSQPGALTRTVYEATYQYSGDYILGSCIIGITGTGTANNAIGITGVPTCIQVLGQTIGAGHIYDAGGNNRYPGLVVMDTGNVLRLQDVATAGIGAGIHLGQNATSYGQALVNNDAIFMDFKYRWR